MANHPPIDPYMKPSRQDQRRKKFRQKPDKNDSQAYRRERTPKGGDPCQKR